MRKIDSIVIHCSDSPFGDAKIIDQWHKERGWSGIGYHYVITNLFPKTTKNKITSSDGLIEEGRGIEKKGSHCYGHNSRSIGICLVGVDEFTNPQYKALKSLCVRLMKEFKIPIEKVKGHYELDSKKTCPNIDADFIRTLVELEKLKGGLGG